MAEKLKEVRDYAEDVQPLLQKMVKEVLHKKPDDVKSFLRSYLAGETNTFTYTKKNAALRSEVNQLSSARCTLTYVLCNPFFKTI